MSEEFEFPPKKKRDIKLKGCENAALERSGPITCLKVGNSFHAPLTTAENTEASPALAG